MREVCISVAMWVFWHLSRIHIALPMNNKLTDRFMDQFPKSDLFTIVV